MLTQETLTVIANNKEFEDKALLIEITELFSEKPEACQFIKLYGEYIELIDDLVDEIVSPMMVEKQTRLGALISSHPYWDKNKAILYLVERLIHNAYFDSVKWEDAQEEWKRRDSKCLSHSGYNMLFAVILIEFGEDKLTELSLRFREHAHKKHLKDDI